MWKEKVEEKGEYNVEEKSRRERKMYVEGNSRELKIEGVCRGGEMQMEVKG